MTIEVLTGDPSQVILGPGVLFCAPIGTTEPTTIAGVTGSSAWREVGWTDAGAAIDIAYKIEPVKVEEEFYPVKYSVVDIVMSVGFAMKQFTRKNLLLATNQGAAGANDGTSVEPPAPGAEVRVMLAHITQEGALWLFRQAIQGDDVKIERKKAPTAALLPVKFNLEKPTGAQPWICYPTAGGLL
jgi:hypothetical protein